VLASVLISSHNYAPYLREAIDSALGQTYPELEVIVVDDGSSDDSPAIVESYGDRIVGIAQENGGPGAAMNTAFGKSRGEIVCLLDADDVFEPHKVERVVAAAREIPGAYLIHHRLQTIDAEGRPMNAPSPRSLPGGDLRELVIRTGGWFPHPVTSGLAFRRAYLEQVFPVPARRAPDTYLAGPAALLAPVAAIGEPLARRRKHGGNRSETVTGATPVSALANFEAETSTLAEVMDERFGHHVDLRLDRHLDYQLVRRAAGQVSRPHAAASVMRSPLLPMSVRVREALRVFAGRGLSAPR
jgi:cellulose synthase/poly-beta-1,6-N-acetylglucosamine synthase-like glycosyltransferase